MNRIYDAERILYHEPMARHTTFRTGGPADCMVFPKNAEEVVRTIALCKAENTPLFIMGNGSNLLVTDKGLRGVVMVFSERFSAVTVEDNLLTVQAGATLGKAANTALEHGLSGLEFASGIPGTLGGGCVMNAGAYGGQLSDVLVDALVLMHGEVVTLSNADMQMGYRTTRPLREGGIVLSARFALTPGDKEVISAKMRDLNGRRRDKQPLNFPSAGSTFKRPEGYFAGALIEQSGLKGATVGGAQVSEKHAGFVINTGNATSQDILDLIAHVQKTVKQNFGVDLETEVRIVGER